MSHTLCEYEDVHSRGHLFGSRVPSASEREALPDAVLSVSEWVKICFFWRLNLPDEGANHLVELAVAGSADDIVTHKSRHLGRPALRLPGIQIVSPKAFLEKIR